eukprot:m.9922 g.9922  ORF g.9922 m.9922 type:complete len:363 (+) comp21740_c0_seq1:51-1139(+)
MAELKPGFFARHKRKFLTLTSVAVGGYALYKFLQWKWTSKVAEEEARRLDDARLEHHFESNQRTCDMTARSLLPSLRKSLFQHLDVDRLKAALKSSQSANKSQLWSRMKTTSLSQLFVAVYGSCLLLVFLRVQLNILGGRLYLQSVEEEETEEGKNGRRRKRGRSPTSQAVQSRYLNIVQCLFETGMGRLSELVSGVVERTVEGVSLKEHYNAEKFNKLVGDVRQGIEGKEGQSQIVRLVSIGFPGDAFEVQSESGMLSEEFGQLKGLVEATADFLENRDFLHVLGQCVGVGFKSALQTVEQKIAEMQGSAGGEGIPLAKLLPLVVNVVPFLLDDTSLFLSQIMGLPILQKFAENVYEAFSK